MSNYTRLQQLSAKNSIWLASLKDEISSFKQASIEGNCNEEMINRMQELRAQTRILTEKIESATEEFIGSTLITRANIDQERILLITLENNLLGEEGELQAYSSFS